MSGDDSERRPPAGISEQLSPAGTSADLAMAQSQLVAYAQDLKTICERERRKSDHIARVHLDVLKRLLRVLSWKDRETAAHNQRLGRYALAIATRLGVGRSEAQLISAGAPMHDIGKIAIPDAILMKEGPLDENEWNVMKTHPALGASLLDAEVSPILKTAKEIALGHHERWDGTGYPQGLSGESIPLSARIVAIGDQYDALRSQRSYKAAFDHRRACEIISAGDGRTRPHHFDPAVLNAFRDIHAELETIFGDLPDEPEQPRGA